MARKHRSYQCSVCGASSPQWMGKCPQCGEWNTLVEVNQEPESGGKARHTQPVPFDSICLSDISKITCGIDELDRVLGGGIVSGSFVLVGGDPGIGKSTIMLQMSHMLCRKGMKILYVSGEESAVQLKIRGERLGVKGEGLYVYAEVMLEDIKKQVEKLKPGIIIIDSIQSVFSSHMDAPPGSVSQVRHVAGALMAIAKGDNIPVFVIGHVTKDGWIAGPKILEHMVDTVLYFEGDSSGAYRVLRATKNRFGPAGEIGVFEMKDIGLEEVRDPSGIFIHGLGGDSPGSAVMATIEGSRVFVVEIQSLVTRTGFSMPRRVSIGVDMSRISVLLAVMEKRSNILMSASDVVVNIAGGIKINEPALDLALFMALASSALDKGLPRATVCVGEIGLNGEVRPVSRMNARLKEAQRMGFTHAVIPEPNTSSLAPVKGLKIVSVKGVTEALDILN